MDSLSEDQIRKSFANCSKGEARRLSLPGKLNEVVWSELDFFGWLDPKAPNNAYLVLHREDRLVGVALRLANQAARSLKRSACALCYSVHDSAGVGLFSAPRIGAAGKLGNTVGTYICADLACSLHVRGLRSPATPQPAESITYEDRATRLRANVNRFLDDILTDNA